MAGKPCDCAVCTEGYPDDLRLARLVFDDELTAHWLITEGDPDWDVASCGTTIDVDNDHMTVREAIPAANICSDCMRNVSAEGRR